MAEILSQCGNVSNMVDSYLWTHPSKRVPLVLHDDDLLLAGRRQSVTEILSELKRDLELQRSEVMTKTTQYLGRTLVRTKRRVQHRSQ